MARTMNELNEALKEDRAGFIKGLMAAGYVADVVFNNSGDDNELVRLAVEIYTDVWDSFDKKEFESHVYRFS